MVRKDIYLSKKQVIFLQSLADITLSEHIRRAIDEYIAEKKRGMSSYTLSPSKNVTYPSH